MAPVTALSSACAAPGSSPNALASDFAASTRLPRVGCAGRRSTSQWSNSRTSVAGQPNFSIVAFIALSLHQPRDDRLPPCAALQRLAEPDQVYREARRRPYRHGNAEIG